MKSPITLVELFQDIQAERGLSYDRVKKYRQLVTALRELLGHDPGTDDLSEATLTGLLTQLRASDLSQRTQRIHANCFNQLWKRAHTKGFTTKPPGSLVRDFAGENLPAKPNRLMPGSEKPGTLRHAFETVFVPAKLAMRTAHTRYQYDLNLRRFDEFLGRPALLSDLDDKAVNSALAWLRETHEYSPSSVEKFRDNLCSTWKYLNHLRLVKSWPSVNDVVVPIKTPVAYTREELTRLYEYLTLLPGDVGGVPAHLWFRCLVAVLWDSGARISSVLATNWDQLDLNSGWFIEKAETRKGGLCDKPARLHPQTCAMLRQIIMPQRKIVFAWPWSRGYLWTQWREITRRAGIRTGPKFMFHCIRKSVATHVRIAGGNAQEALGHYDPKMTEQVYIDPTQAPKTHAADVLFRLHEPGDAGNKSAGGSGGAIGGIGADFRLKDDDPEGRSGNVA